MKPVQFVALAMTFAAIFCNNDPKENTPLDIQIFHTDEMTFRGLGLGLGADAQKSPSKSSFGLNFGLKTSIVGSKEKAGWGISCNGSVDNSCHITSDEQYQISYFSKQFTAQHAELYLRPDPNTSVDVFNPPVDKAQVDLVVGGNGWIFNDWGVLGLSPTGTFSKYLTNLYGKKADIVFKFHAEDYTVPNDQLVYHLDAYLNPVYRPVDVIKEIPLDQNAQSWYATANIDFISEKWSFKNEKLCFNTDDVLVQVDDFADRCEAVKSVVCNGKTGKDCTHAIADFSKAPKLVIDLNGAKFEFAPEEYLYYDKEVVDCRFGPIAGLKNNHACEADTKLGLGKFFLHKYIPVLRFRHGAQSSVILLKNFYNPAKNFLNNRTMWLTIMSVSAITTFIVFVFVALKKQKLSDENVYNAAPNQPLIVNQ